MLVAVEGCAHGELETIYNCIAETEKKTGKKVDLLICCGDFQAVRNSKDLECMAVSDKHKDIGSFHKYYSGEKEAPILTIFIGGNHEASNYLQELAYGGWVAPNIYYLGYAGVVNVAGVRIAGLSGIYKSHDWLAGHYEYPPYNSSSMRSAYHIRNLETFRLKQLSGNIDIFLSHDWPLGIWQYGNKNALLRKKPFFKEDIEKNCLGSPPAMELLEHHYPQYWFSAHLHCKFAALVPNKDDSKVTKFLALDKCLPKRGFLQIVEIPSDSEKPIKLSYDLEWLTVLFLTNHLLSITKGATYMPTTDKGRCDFTPSEEEKTRILNKFQNSLDVPLNFKKTVVPYAQETPKKYRDRPNLMINEQTKEFCNTLGIDDPFVLLKLKNNIREEIPSDVSDLSDLSHNASNLSSLTPTSSIVSQSCTSSYIDVSLSSDEERSVNFIIDTNPSYDTSIKMTPLKLPPAINSSVEDDTNEVEKTAKKSPAPVPDEVAVTPSEATVEPNYKKFKRRNQSMYSSLD